MPRHLSRLMTLAAAAAVAAVGACAPAPVDWGEARVVSGQEAADGAESARLQAPLANGAANGMAARSCEELARYASGSDSGKTMFTVWWAVRDDSSAALLSARSDDGGQSWGKPVTVDTLDRGTRGCARPAPSVAYDPAGGYVHVVYYMEAPQGPGLFFSHSMDRGLTYHERVAIAYGERPVAASVAADHDTVAVAYVDPNSARGRIMLAASRTAGHIFEQKAIPVSGDGAASPAAPRVAVRGRAVTITWREGSGVVERTGVLKP